MAEKSTYSYQYPAEGIMNLLYGTSAAPGYFPMLQSYYGDQFQNLGQADSSPYTYTGDRIAGFAPREEYGMELADATVGQYKPYLDRQQQLTEQGIDVQQEGVDEAAQKYRQMEQAQYDPSSYTDYEDPYTDAVTNKIIEDISKEGALKSQGLSAGQVSQGAFGGSRGRLSQEELQRAMTDQAVGALAGVRSQGYGQAQDRAAAEFGRQQGARGMAAQGIAGLSGQLGGAYGQAGQTYGGLAAAYPGMAREDINAMMGIGGLQRGMQQSGMDLNYQNFVGQYNLPGQLFGQYGNFLGSLGPMAGGTGYSGVGNPPGYGSYGQAGYNPHMTPYTGQNTTNPNPNPGNPNPGNPPTEDDFEYHASGGQVKRRANGGGLSGRAKRRSRPTSIGGLTRLIRGKK